MPDINENAETQQEYFGIHTDNTKTLYNALNRIVNLEAQIEKMKLCANCKHCGVSGWCNKLNRYLLDKANQRCGNWELRE